MAAMVCSLGARSARCHSVRGADRRLVPAVELDEPCRRERGREVEALRGLNPRGADRFQLLRGLDAFGQHQQALRSGRRAPERRGSPGPSASHRRARRARGPGVRWESRRWPAARGWRTGLSRARLAAPARPGLVCPLRGRCRRGRCQRDSAAPPRQRPSARNIARGDVRAFRVRVHRPPRRGRAALRAAPLPFVPTQGARAAVLARRVESRGEVDRVAVAV